jgi:hypothetical protein
MLGCVGDFAGAAYYRPDYRAAGLRGARGFAAVLGLAFGLAFGLLFGATSAAAAGGAFGMSPSRVLAGQIRNAGHFWQPATMAIGQMVMGIPLDDCETTSQYGRECRPQVVGFT